MRARFRHSSLKNRPAVSVSAWMPKKVSKRQRTSGLRQGRSRWPFDNRQK